MSGPHGWIRDVVEAAEDRDWVVVSFDARAGVLVLEEPGDGLTLRIVGRMLAPAFVRALPLAVMPSRRRMLDGSPCWCVSIEEPHEGWIHSPRCLERRVAAGVSDA